MNLILSGGRELAKRIAEAVLVAAASTAASFLVQETLEWARECRRTKKKDAPSEEENP